MQRKWRKKRNEKGGKVSSGGKIRRGDEWRGEKEEKKYVGLKSTDII